MSFEDPRDKAREFGLAALEAMERHRVALTPLNYRIWYTFVAGRDQDLVKRLNELIGSSAEFTPELNLDIYEQFFDGTTGAEDLRTSSSKLESIVSEMLVQLDRSTTDQSAYCERMVTLSGNIAAAPNERLAGLIKEILTETQDIVRKSQDLKEQLNESASEVAELRRHLQKVREDALTDGLTQIGNRKMLDLRLREETARARETGEPLCVALADIDHFKAFNDTYGHRIGDEVLCLAARILKDSVKGQDTPARYGGEEFCLVLPRTSLQDATRLANGIRHTLENRVLTSKKTGESYGRITISFGVSQYRRGEPVDEFLNRADTALYRAKAAGRNRVECEAHSDSELTLAS